MSDTLIEQFKDRHPATLHLLGFFEVREDAPQPMRGIMTDIRGTASAVTLFLEDGPELTAGLRKLLEARNCFVRQAFSQSHEPTGE